MPYGGSRAGADRGKGAAGCKLLHPISQSGLYEDGLKTSAFADSRYFLETTNAAFGESQSSDTMRNILLKLKIRLIKNDLEELLLAEGVQPMIWSFGAYYIDPKHLVFVVGVETDLQRNRLRANCKLAQRMQELLIKWRWPEAARPDVKFDIESKESVARESKGNWWHHYK